MIRLPKTLFAYLLGSLAGGGIAVVACLMDLTVGGGALAFVIIAAVIGLLLITIWGWDDGEG